MNEYALDPQKRDRDVQAIMEEAEKHGPRRTKKTKISPGDTAPVLLQLEGKNTARVMRWGFPNHWNEGEVYAAKAETVEERTTFRKSVEERRCIIPTTGYYEKKESGHDAGRYILHLHNTNELYVAGIYNGFKSEDDGKEEYYFAMLTTQATESVEDFNERMPVVLRKDEWNKWLRGEYEDLLGHRDIILRSEKVLDD